MNELVWEGLLEIVREGQPSLKAAARLWRRDDFFGSDWGGQLELPVVFRRLLPAEEYLVRLPSGLEGRARIASGPSTTTMTFPTLTGIGNPPFGASAGASDAEANAAPTEDVEDIEDVRAPEVSRPPVDSAAAAPRSGERATRRGGRGARGARGSRSNAPQTSEPETGAEASPAAASDDEAPVATGPSLETTPPRASAPPPRANSDPRPSPSPSQAPATAPAIILRSPARPRAFEEAPKSTGRPTRARSAPRRAADPEVEVSVEQTESLARAFLAAVEARDKLGPLEREGFEGRAITAARQDIELVAAALETALRSMDGATRWADELRQPFALLGWFASLAAPDSRTGVAEAGEAVESMLATIEGVLALGLLEDSSVGSARAA